MLILVNGSLARNDDNLLYCCVLAIEHSLDFTYQSSLVVSQQPGQRLKLLTYFQPLTINLGLVILAAQVQQRPIGEVLAY